MARARRKLVGIARETAERKALDEQQPPEDDPTAQTEEQLEDADDDGERPPEVRVSRIDPEDGKPKFLTVAPPNRVNEDWLKKKYGGGEYTTVVYGTRNDGTFGWIKGTRKRYAIDASIPFKGANGDALRGEIRNVGDGGDEDTKFLVKNQLMEMMRDQSEARQHTASMMMTMMKMMADSTTAQTQAMAAIIGSLRNDKSGGVGELMPLLLASINGRGDPLDLATKLVALTKSDSDGAGGLGNLETMLTLAERLGRRLNGIPDEQDSDAQWVGVVKEMGPKALELLTTMARKRESESSTQPAAPQPRRVNPQPVVITAAAPVTPAPTAPSDEWTPLEPAVTHLLAAAREGKDVRHVVGMLMFMASAEQIATLREVVAQDDVADVFVARFPDFAHRRVWLDDFLDELRAELLSTDNDETDDAPDGPQPDNAEPESTT